MAATAKAFEDYVIGGLVKAVTALLRFAGVLVREMQSGYLSFYIGTLIVGVILWRYLGGLPI